MAEPTRSDERTLLCCYLVYALAPEGMSRREADNLFNDYVAQTERGMVCHHDHFLDRAGAFAVFEATTETTKQALKDPGPLKGWQINAHPLVFSPHAAGFFEQADSTMRHFRFTRLDQGPANDIGCHDYTLAPGGGHI